MQARALKEELPTDAIEVRSPGACVLLMNRVARKLSLPQHSPAGTSRHLHAGKRAHICAMASTEGLPERALQGVSVMGHAASRLCSPAASKRACPLHGDPEGVFLQLSLVTIRTHLHHAESLMMHKRLGDAYARRPPSAGEVCNACLRGALPSVGIRP